MNELQLQKDKLQQVQVAYDEKGRSVSKLVEVSRPIMILQLAVHYHNFSSQLNFSIDHTFIWNLE
jgi:hypothetical protein